MGSNILKTFYSLDALLEDVTSDSPRGIELETICEDLLRHLDIDGGFLGVIDDFGTSLQVIRHADGRFWVEIPNSVRHASFGLFVTFPELQHLFKTIPDRISEAHLEGGDFVTWGNND